MRKILFLIPIFIALLALNNYAQSKDTLYFRSNISSKKISEMINSTTNLLYLDISFKKIDSLCIDKAKLNKLKQLCLYRTYTDTLPEWIKGLPKLEYVEILGDENIDLKQAFIILSSLPNLKKLSLSGSYLVKIPNEIGLLKNLEELDLSRNRWDSLPENLKNLKKLKKLDLSETLQFFEKEAITVISEITSLEYLTIEYCDWRSSLAGISKLVNLKELALTGNRITEISPEIGELKNLEVLRLEDNKIMELPSTIKKLKHLRVLSLALNLINKKERKKIRNYVPNCIVDFDNYYYR